MRVPGASAVALLTLAACGGNASDVPRAATSARAVASVQRANELCHEHAADAGAGKVTLVSLTPAGEVVRLISELGTDKDQASIWRQMPARLLVATCAVEPIAASPSLTPCPDGTYAELPTPTVELILDDAGHHELVTLRPPVGIPVC